MSGIGPALILLGLAVAAVGGVIVGLAKQRRRAETERRARDEVRRAAKAEADKLERLRLLRQSFPPIGNLHGRCPYCDKAIRPTPAKRGRCPHCGQDVHFRKRPHDDLAVLVTAAQALQIGEQWDAYYDASRREDEA